MIGTLTLIAPTVNAAGKTIVGSGLSLHMTTSSSDRSASPAYIYFGLTARRTRERHGYEAEPFALFAVKTAVIGALALFLVYQFATYKGLPIVLVVMALLISLFVFVTKRMTIGRRIYAHGRQRQGGAAVGHQHRAPDADRLHQHGRAVGAGRPDHRGAPRARRCRRQASAASST